MQRQTAADALIDAGREVVTAIGSERDRPGEGKAGDPAGTLVVGTLLLLAAAEAPILVVGVVGYVITAARDHERPISGFDDWVAIGATGVRGTGLLVGAALPVVAALGGSGLLGVEAGLVTVGSGPGPVLAAGIGVLALAAWHAAVVGTAAVTVDGDWSTTEGVRFARSATGFRLSGALAGLATGVGVIGVGATAIPVVGSAVAAGVGTVGVVITSHLVGHAVAGWDPRSESVWSDASEDRLAVPSDGSAGVHGGYRDGRTGQHGNPNRETVQRDTEAERGRVRPAATPRGPRREHP